MSGKATPHKAPLPSAPWREIEGSRGFGEPLCDQPLLGHFQTSVPKSGEGRAAEQRDAVGTPGCVAGMRSLREPRLHGGVWGLRIARKPLEDRARRASPQSASQVQQSGGLARLGSQEVLLLSPVYR